MEPQPSRREKRYKPKGTVNEAHYAQKAFRKLNVDVINSENMSHEHGRAQNCNGVLY